jgi:hypothetical protein
MPAPALNRTAFLFAVARQLVPGQPRVLLDLSPPA